jgi:two-component system response regulator YesN
MLSEDVGLVFLDYILPLANGLDVLRQIKKMYPTMPVIFITAYGSEEVCQSAFRTGAWDYIKKPFNQKEIRLKTDILMNRHDDHRSRFDLSLDLPGEHTPPADNENVNSDVLYSILKVKKYIDENYTKPISLSEASKMASINKTYFCCYFKRITGQSFIDYLNNVRVERSKEFLRNKNLPIKDIAAVVGYRSINYFAVIFKKITGYSPQEFRKHIKINAEKNNSKLQSVRQ